MTVERFDLLASLSMAFLRRFGLLAFLSICMAFLDVHYPTKS